MDFEILDILINCDFPLSSFLSFAEDTRSGLRRLSGDDLECRLLSRLPANSGPGLVTRFIAALFSQGGGQGGQGEGHQRKLDLEIMNILINSEFPASSFLAFVGETRPDFRRLSMDDLETRLRNRLPPNPATPSLVTRFITALFSQSQEGQGQGVGHPIPPVPPLLIPIVKAEVKQEAADSSTPEPAAVTVQLQNERQNNQEEPENSTIDPVLPQSQVVADAERDSSANNNMNESKPVIGHDQSAEDSDDDVVMLDEVIKTPDVAIIGVVDAETKAKERVVGEVTLQDEDNEVQPAPVLSPPPAVRPMSPIASTSTAQPEPPQAIKTVTFSTPIAQKSRSGRKRKAAAKRSDILPSAADKGKIDKLSVLKLGRHSNLGQWTKKTFTKFTSPPQSLCVEELSILSNCSYSMKSSSRPAVIHLPKLTTLKIRHRVKTFGDEDLSSHDINYAKQLGLILAGSPSLSRIEISFEEEMALKTILRVLWSEEGLQLNPLLALYSLTIRHRDENDLVALLASDLIELTRIKAPNLKELHLACCIWAEGDGTGVKDAVENILKTFPNLTKLKIEGCFITSPNTVLPKIVLDFPRLKHLEILDLGASCKYSSTLETVEERPKKKKRKKLVTNSEPEIAQDNGNKPAEIASYPLPDHLIDDERGEYFSIGINFSGPMPSLRNITLGVLYEFHTLYFSELPALKVFRVASGWAQSYPKCFPERKGRTNKEDRLPETSNVEQLQLPDSFQDEFIISKILAHFPNLTHIYINLPTVKFLRAFAKTMQLSAPNSFKHLLLKTQFEFASTLESCVLDKIVKPSSLEKEHLRILKAYPHWEDYVKENQIELPPEGEEEAEDKEKFCGLGVLLKKLNTVKIRHIPRTLRLPKGPRHWIDHPVPEYTDTIIGFKEYPFSRAVKSKCPSKLTITCYDFDMSQVENDFNIKPYYEGGRVRVDPTGASVKKEVKSEKTWTPPTASVISLPYY